MDSEDVVETLSEMLLELALGNVPPVMPDTTEDETQIEPTDEQGTAPDIAPLEAEVTESVDNANQTEYRSKATGAD